MTYELRLERLIDAPPEVDFDAFVDPDTQAELHGSPAAARRGQARRATGFKGEA